ncbi:hypothetical protein [Catonella massiliensis]|uniref:Uncharacterized protein n=1 Tax=Catonella massiliensis TaxID=2799636 RepID=A0ABS1J176_9FIRM|nr:hypothetical protein [Catonella massiliensis]MBK5897894.1 hypothetical protein [Catonella massiliensis]
MRRTKVLLAGVMAMSLAISSAVVPVKAGVITGSGVGRYVAATEKSEISLPVYGMDSERLHFTIVAITKDNKSLGNVFETMIPVTNGQVNLPTINNKIVPNDMDDNYKEDLASYSADNLVYIFDLQEWWKDDGSIEENSVYTSNKYNFSVLGGTKQKGSLSFKLVNGQLVEWDNDNVSLTKNIIDRVVIRSAKEYTKTPVDFPEFDVVYTDGSKVEDGVAINIMADKSEGGESKVVRVKDGKIKPDFKLKSNILCAVGIAKDTVNSKLVKIIESNYDDITTVNTFVDENGKAYIMNGIFNFEDKTKPFNKITIEKKTEAPLYTGPVVAIGVQPVEELKDISDDKTALGESSGAAVKGKRIAPGKDVKVADIAVVFEDGTKVHDGVTLDNFRMKDIWAEPAHYKVKDGKISGIVLKADEQYKLGFDVTNADYNNYEVVGAYKSKKLLRVYARYEGGVLLKYDYDEGIEAPEKEISKIVIKKTDGKPSKLPVSTSCLMNLILSDHGYQPQGVLPFRLVRLDNKKSTLVYSSKDGILSLNGEAGVWYEMKLDKNPLYKLKDKTVFRFVLNKEGKYVALLKGYKNPDNLEGVVTSHYVDLVRLDGKIPVGPALDTDECATGAKYSLKDYKIIYNTKRALVKDIPVQFKSSAFKKPVKFEVYNATKQKVEKVVLSKDGKLSGLKLIVGNDYIISALDKEYSMKNAYVTISNDGKKLITSKAPYGEFKGFKLVKREKALTDEKLANRVPYKLPVYVLGNNKKKVNNVTLKFISPRETFEAKVVDGWVDLSLLEDTNYVMEVVKGNYAIDAFPLTVKDKSEFGAKKYVFNHLSCGSVQALYLINKKQAHKNDTTLVSSDGTTKVTGFRFGNGEYALSSRVLKNVKVPELKGKNYLVLDVDTVNMYRVELSPLAYGNFKVTTTVAGKKPVKNVYYIDGANKLQKVKFTQKGDKLTFNMNSMARYNTVIEYK